MSTSGTPTAAQTPAGTAADLEANVARVVAFFETLTPTRIADLGVFYDAQARFVVTGQVLQGRQCFLTWEFHFSFKTYKPDSGQVIRGASQLLFSEQGLITRHRDYWDAAEDFYEKLPFLGSLLRWLKKRASR